MGKVVIGEKVLRLAAWVLVGIAILGVGMGVAGWLVKTAPEAPKVAPEVVVPTVEVEMVETADFPILLSAQGEVMAQRQTRIASEVGGKVIEVSPKFESGEVFEEGEILLRIEPTDYRAAHANAMANLENARLAFEVEIANGERVRRDWKKLGTGEASDLVLRKPQLASARAAVTSAEAAVEKALLDLERTEVRALYPCRLERTHVDLGATVAPGSPLVDVMSLGAVEVRLPLSLEDFGYLKRGDAGDVTGEVIATAQLGGETRTWRGRVLRSEGFVERTTRTVTVIVEFGDEEGSVPTVGLFVNGTVEGRTLKDVVILPRLAMAGPTRVMVVDDENKLEFRDVELVRTGEDTVVIGSGLEAGERVCITPLNAPVNGMPIEVRQKPGKEGEL